MISSRSRMFLRGGRSAHATVDGIGAGPDTPASSASCSAATGSRSKLHLAHSPPTPAADIIGKFFGCNVTFNSEFDAIRILTRAIMDRPIPSAHPMLARYVRKPRRGDRRTARALGRQGRRIGSRAAAGRRLHDRTVAEHLACDRRTVHRRCSERGTSFSAILDAERADLAMRLVEDGDRPLKEIAGLLGFSAQSAHGALVSRTASAAASPNGAAAIRQRAAIARSAISARSLEHDPEKWVPVFPRDKRDSALRGAHRGQKRLERDMTLRRESSRSMASGRAHRVQELADFELEAVAVTRQRLRRR